MNVQISRERINPISDFSGERISIEQLIEKHSKHVSDYVRMLVKNVEVAEDICQETFVRILNETSKGRYVESGKFLSWALRIAHNMAIDSFRDSKKNPEITEKEAGYNMLSTLSDSDSSDERLVSEHAGIRIRAMIDTLPEDQRQVVRMKYYDDLTFREIAERTGVSINTALGRMRYALINLKKMMGGSMDFLCIEQ